MTSTTSRLISHDPATLEKVGSVSSTTVDEVRRAVERGRKAAKDWSATTIPERAAALERAAELLAERSEIFAKLISREEGKPLRESRSETLNTADRIRYFAESGPKVLESRMEPVRDITGIVEYRPRGVVAAVKPWNFPVNIPAWTLAPALLAGNAVVFKPSELTPLCGRKLVELFWEAGIPRNVLQIVQGGDAVGKALVAAPVDMIAFVGSLEAGRSIAKIAAPDFKQLALEMAGKDPAIVLDDAVIDEAVELLVHGAFKNCGQVCCSCERIYVDRKIYPAFVEAFVERTRRLVLGHGLEESVEIGPMIRREERQRVEAFVADARKRGARILTGGVRPKLDLPGAFYSPTVLTRVPDSAVMMRKEIFGPAIPILPVRDEEEAVKRANALPFGLTATVWSADRDRGARIARRIEAGTVAVNSTTGSIVQHPWGGVKSSGFGRMLGLEGIRSFTQVVTIRIANR
mgnify:CR=1 FL=1